MICFSVWNLSPLGRLLSRQSQQISCFESVLREALSSWPEGPQFMNLCVCLAHLSGILLLLSKVGPNSEPVHANGGGGSMAAAAPAAPAAAAMPRRKTPNKSRSLVESQRSYKRCFFGGQCPSYMRSWREGPTCWQNTLQQQVCACKRARVHVSR